MKTNEFKRPVVQLIGDNDNVFQILTLCEKNLEKVAPTKCIQEMHQRVLSAKDYDEAISIMEEYCEIV